MIADWSVFGVFLNGALVSALIALLLHIPLRLVFRWSGLYRYFWHPAMANIALFVILWGGVAFLLGYQPSFVAAVFG